MNTSVQSRLPDETLTPSYDFQDTNIPVVVIVPFGNHNDPQELGRYQNLSVALKIVSDMKLPEYRIYSLITGDRLQLH